MWTDAPHFDGKQFLFPGDTSRPGLREILKWKLTSQAKPWAAPEPVVARPAPPAPAEGMTVTWIGHSSFLVQTPQLALLIDPVFSERASPFARLGPKRAVGPGVAFASLPRLDAVLVSHDHYDHCDVAALKQLARDHRAVLVTPLGYGPLLGSLGFRDHVQLDWWQEQSLAGGSVRLVPSRHWCRRLPWDTNRRLWGGFVLRAAGRMLYFVGDSGYQVDLFKEIRTRCGAPDIALIPIGAYEPRWFMADAHMNPAEAVQVHLDVAARQSIGMHWGTFQLTDEPRLEPVEHLASASAEKGLKAGEFVVLPPGGSLNA